MTCFSFQMVILVGCLSDYQNSWMIADSTRLNKYISEKIRNLMNKTGSRHFQGIVPNIFIRKSTILRRIRGLSIIFGVLPVFNDFPAIKPEVDIFATRDYFWRKFQAKTRRMSHPALKSVVWESQKFSTIRKKITSMWRTPLLLHFFSVIIKGIRLHLRNCHANHTYLLWRLHHTWNNIIFKSFWVPNLKISCWTM